MVLRIITLFGVVQIAANGVANNLSALGCIPGQAMNLAMITVVGQCVGAGSRVQARHYTRRLMAVTYLFTVAVNTLILLSLPLTLRLYSLSDESLALARVLIFIHNGFAMLLWPAAFTLPNALARRRRRAVHNDRIGFFDGGLPHRAELGALPCS